MKHNWEWMRRWNPWAPPTRRCIRCGAKLRLKPEGRGGPRYAYRSPDFVAYITTNTMPPCDSRLASRRVRQKKDAALIDVPELP